MYILDEPSIGLHQRDNHRLIDSLRKLRDAGNSVVVVEHDKDMMLASDYTSTWVPLRESMAAMWYLKVILMKCSNRTLTSNYLNGKLEVALPEKRRTGNGKWLVIEGASGNNLKEVTASFPLVY